MENRQYEKNYSEAREALARRGKRLGNPVYLCGVRHCDLEGLLVTDRAIFAEAWNESIADEIIQEHEAIAGQQSGWLGRGRFFPACPECELLFRAYGLLHESYLDLLGRGAEAPEQGMGGPAALEASREKRKAARLAIIKHGASHRSLTKTA